MEEIQKQIIAIQLIQELIVDKCDEAGIFSRDEFETELKVRVDKLNSEIQQLSKKMNNETKSKPVMFMGGEIGEA